jgi:drug/metabolite transporter (DMT)-like permease
MDLNKVYPYTALTLVLVIVASVILFREPIPLTRWIGVGVIVTGFFIMSIK